MTALTPLITEQGWAALTRAQSQGQSVHLTAMALGDAIYTPSESCTNLQHECQRVSIAQVTALTSKQLQLTARVQGELEYWIYEWGVFLEDGTLFAIWSNEVALAYKAKNTDLVLTLDLILSQLPSDVIQVSETTTNVELCHAETFTTFSRVLIDTLRRQVEINRRTLNEFRN